MLEAPQSTVINLSRRYEWPCWARKAYLLLVLYNPIPLSGVFQDIVWYRLVVNIRIVIVESILFYVSPLLYCRFFLTIFDTYF